MGIALVACSGTGGGTAQGNTTPGTTQTGNTPTSGTSKGGTTTVPTSVPGTPGTGPVIILSPTPVPGGGAHSQQVLLPDRTLIINNVSQSAGANANMVTVTLSLEVKNTGSKSIMNQLAYFLMNSSEGDSFSPTSSATSSFYGTIGANSSHSGTLVFQIPSAAVKGLRLMYHPEVATDTTFIPIVLS